MKTGVVSQTETYSGGADAEVTRLYQSNDSNPPVDLDETQFNRTATIKIRSTIIYIRLNQGG